MEGLIKQKCPLLVELCLVNCKLTDVASLVENFGDEPTIRRLNISCNSLRTKGFVDIMSTNQLSNLEELIAMKIGLDDTEDVIEQSKVRPQYLNLTDNKNLKLNLMSKFAQSGLLINLKFLKVDQIASGS